MKTDSKNSRLLTLVFILATAMTSIGFVSKRHVAGYRPKDISVEIKNRYGNFFIDEEDVMKLVMTGEKDAVLGDKQGRVDMKEIEDRIESHSFVKEAQVFRDLKGHLVVRVYQNRPVARLIAGNGKQAYISEGGDLLPMSAKYTSRVVVLTGGYLNKVTQLHSVREDEYAMKLFDLASFINSHRFWQMQIGEVHVADNGKITMYPQVGKQKLEFGHAENIEEKFKKLKIFFKEIMPTKGWNTYSRVNVTYKDQIICE